MIACRYAERLQSLPVMRWRSTAAWCRTQSAGTSLRPGKRTWVWVNVRSDGIITDAMYHDDCLSDKISLRPGKQIIVWGYTRNGKSISKARKNYGICYMIVTLIAQKKGVLSICYRGDRNTIETRCWYEYKQWGIGILLVWSHCPPIGKDRSSDRATSLMLSWWQVTF